MNNDQLKGSVKNITGKMQQETGKLTGDKEEQLKGIGNRISGSAQKSYGDAKEVVRAVFRLY